MIPSTSHFKANARAGLADADLQRALATLSGGLVARHAEALAQLGDVEALRDTGRDIRDDALANLDVYLEAFDRQATAAGARLHWAATAAEAREAVLAICREAGARLVTKGKSMVSEEIGLNEHLLAAGIEVVETDLGEYLVQIRGETPSHIIAPAIHLTEAQVEADFRRTHCHLRPDRDLSTPTALVAEARAIMREKFLAADVGITGANFLVAETGSAVIVTNEGNGDLTHTLPKVHVVIASIEKIVGTLADTAVVLRLLTRSATGQDMTAYTSFVTGPRRAHDGDGPSACHIVLVDNGRSELLRLPARDVLRCIRCGACLNHCPVYGAVGGHAYGWIYPGPIGAALTPALIGVRESAPLPAASSFCGRCEEVCPVRIPLTRLMRHWRGAAYSSGAASLAERLSVGAWGLLARHPRLYHVTLRFLAAILGALGRRRGVLRRLPFAGGWTRTRDLPAPQGRTFQQLWAEARRGVER